jgi:chlorobactene glucosyltransferase
MIYPVLFWLLTLSLGYLLYTSLIFIRNRFELPSVFRAGTCKTFPKISVCIPARNEEETLSPLLESLIQQGYPDMEILVLDDNSEDNTANVVQSFRDKYPGSIRLLTGKPLPGGWLGKPWACQQLAEHAVGEILLFLDADTRIHPGFPEGVVSSFEKDGVDMLTVWPRQITRTFWEKTVIPLVYHALLTILPVIYVWRKPRWMPAFVYRPLKSRFAAANGQCIVFRRNAYDTIGGHQSVKHEVIEDVAIARKVREHNLRMRMYHGVGGIDCRMYRTHGELFKGLRKNILAGYGYSFFLFAISSLIHLVVYILPFPGLVAGWTAGDLPVLFLSASSISLILLQRLLLARWFRLDPLYSFTHPVGVIWFQWLGLVSVFDQLSGRRVEWKGRAVNKEKTDSVTNE